MTPLQDAHCHYQDPHLAPHEAAWAPQLTAAGLNAAVVNGTRESDWPQVAALAERLPWCRPAYGLHPWYLPERSAHWSAHLAEHLRAAPQASVGECGLDRWMDHPDSALQAGILREHLALARAYDRPVTIHCLRAWGALLELLQQTPLPPRGFLLHAYGGSAEMVPRFAKLGAFFSFSPYFLHPRKTAIRKVFAASVPADRLLLETDAPAMLPPLEQQQAHLPDDPTASHPLNLLSAAHGLAKLRGWSLTEVAATTSANFAGLFI